MKRLLLVLCLMLVTTSVFANWKLDEMLIIPRVNNDAITIDGVMDEPEWSYVLNSGIGNLFDRDDYFAEFGVLYDDEFLYFYFVVEDDWLDYQASTWNTDAVEIYLDCDNSKEESFDGVDDYQITCTVGAADVSEWVGSGDYPRDNIQYVLMETDLGYEVEMALPIGDFGILDFFGLDVALNDADDTGAREDQIWFWGGEGASWNRPIDFLPIPPSTNRSVKHRTRTEMVWRVTESSEF